MSSEQEQDEVIFQRVERYGLTKEMAFTARKTPMVAKTVGGRKRSYPSKFRSYLFEKIRELRDGTNVRRSMPVGTTHNQRARLLIQAQFDQLPVVVSMVNLDPKYWNRNQHLQLANFKAGETTELLVQHCLENAHETFLSRNGRRTKTPVQPQGSTKLDVQRNQR